MSEQKTKLETAKSWGIAAASVLAVVVGFPVVSVIASHLILGSLAVAGAAIVYTSAMAVAGKNPWTPIRNIFKSVANAWGDVLPFFKKLNKKADEIAAKAEQKAAENPDTPGFESTGLKTAFDETVKAVKDSGVVKDVVAEAKKLLKKNEPKA